MIFLGLLIAVAAAVFAGVLLGQNWGGTTHTIHGFGATLGSLTLAEIFLAGIILTAIFFLALWLASLGTRIHRRRVVRRRDETRSARDDRDGLIADRDRLARELDDERARGRAGYTSEPYPREGAAAGAGAGRAGYDEPGYTAERETTVYRDPASGAGGAGYSGAAGAPEGAGYRDAPTYPDDPHDPALYRDGGYQGGGYRDGGYQDGGYSDGGYSDGGYSDGGYRGGYEERSTERVERVARDRDR